MKKLLRKEKLPLIHYYHKLVMGLPIPLKLKPRIINQPMLKVLQHSVFKVPQDGQMLFAELRQLPVRLPPLSLNELPFDEWRGALLVWPGESYWSLWSTADSETFKNI